MRKTGFSLLMSLISIGMLAGNVGLAEDGITYNTSANIVYTDTNGKVFTGIGTITITSGDTSITMLDRNLGATMTGYGAEIGAYGYRFQRGNNYGFPTTGDISTSTGIVDTSEYSRKNPYVSGIFVRVAGSSKSWDIKTNMSLWGGDNNDNPDYMRQGPCPAGYHVATALERGELWNIYSAIYGSGEYESFMKEINFQAKCTIS